MGPGSRGSCCREGSLGIPLVPRHFNIAQLTQLGELGDFFTHFKMVQNKILNFRTKSKIWNLNQLNMTLSHGYVTYCVGDFSII